MKLLKKSRYALYALIDLSACAEGSYVTLSSIAQRSDVSPQYLEQIFSSLRKGGIVKGAKGHQGGYVLGMQPEKITVAKILEAVEGEWLYPEEVKDGSGRETADAVQNCLISKVNEMLEDFLTTLTLADLQKYYLENRENGQHMYYI